MTSRRRAPGNVVVDVLQPGQPEDDRAEEEAAVDVRPEEDQERDRPQARRVRAAIGEQQEDHREDGHPEQLRAQRERDRGDEEGDHREQRRAPRAETAQQADRQQAPEDQPDQHCPEDDESGPAGELVDGRQDHLGAPLLVGPRGAGHRERPGVDRRDPATVEHLGARPQVIGQVDARQVRDERGERRQGDGQEDPESRQGHATMLAMVGVPTHRDVRTVTPRMMPPGQPAAATSDGRTVRAPSS